MRYPSWLLSLLFYGCTNNPIVKPIENTRIEGTLIIAVVIRDGIVIASDSRGSIGRTPRDYKNPIAYIDSINKIHLLKKYMIAVAGSTMLGGKPISKVIAEFNKNEPNDINFEDTFKRFHDYINSRYPFVAFPERFNQVFIGGGYNALSPQLSIFQRVPGIQYTKEIICSYNDAYDYAKGYEKLSSVKEMAPFLENAIRRFAADKKMTGSIGGPIPVYYIPREGKGRFIQNDFTNKYPSDYTMYVKNIKAGKIKMVPLEKNGREHAISLLESTTYYKP